MTTVKNNVPRLKQFYQDKVVPELMQEFQYKNIMQVPEVEKVVISIGLGEYIQNHKALEFAQNDLAAIAAQKPVVARAKKAISNFKLRKGMPIGLKVTLRGRRMYYFLDRLLNLALPRIRDFRGVSGKSFDKNGNYTMGLREQLIFPEISYDKVDKVRGMNITIVTSANTNQESYALLKHLGMPFKK